MINPEHLRQHIIRPTLEYLDPVIPYSMAAENLLMGTCAQESAMGEHLVQLGGGPAQGIYQMELATEGDIWKNYIRYRESMTEIVRNLMSSTGGAHFYDKEMIGNLYYATAMCRVHYWRATKEPLPAHDDIEDMGHYWKAYYNTMKGKGTEDHFIANYYHFVL